MLYSTVATLTGSAEGWKTRTVDWDIDASTIYWLAVQLDAVSGTSDIDYAATGGEVSIDVGISTLQNPWVNDGTSAYILALYAVVEAGTTPIDISGTIAGISSLSGTLTLSTQINITGIIDGTSSLSGTLTLNTLIDITGTVVATSSMTGSLILSSDWQIGSEIPTKRLIQIGNNALYYEDI